ncbi:hypothetical protein HHI36_003454 [Cryptolaemus montrouzieri]|uniref:Solute carrier family 46 member 3 n=1 Tax=Cryptolaemus montrouzieri TaxID=559131 RepID=A0ABD2PEE6_9CUCU
MPCLKEKLKIAMKCVTLEPVVFFYMVSFMMNGLINQNLSLEKACRVNLGFNASVCDAMVLRNRSGYSFEEEVEVQLLVTKFATYRSFLLGSIPFFMLLFFGSWSDRYLRRKPLILIPTVGEIVGTAGVFVCSQLLLELPLEVSFVFEIMPTVLFGGMQCFFLGVFSYVSGLCTDEDRTFRIGTVSMCYPIGMSMGLFLSGFTLNRLGYRGAYTISISCMIFAFLYGFFMIKENSRQKTEEEKKIGFLRDIFDMKHITNTLNMFFKEKRNIKE